MRSVVRCDYTQRPPDGPALSWGLNRERGGAPPGAGLFPAARFWGSGRLGRAAVWAEDTGGLGGLAVKRQNKRPAAGAGSPGRWV